MSDEDPRLKRRQYGTFNCTHPDCSKVFVRHDHLLRHQRNHDPQRQIACGWPNCTATFARTDVREKHYKRHSIRSKREIGSPDDTTSVSSNSPGPGPGLGGSLALGSHELPNSLGPELGPNPLGSHEIPYESGPTGPGPGPGPGPTFSQKSDKMDPMVPMDQNQNGLAPHKLDGTENGPGQGQAQPFFQAKRPHTNSFSFKPGQNGSNGQNGPNPGPNGAINGPKGPNTGQNGPNGAINGPTGPAGPGPKFHRLYNYSPNLDFSLLPPKLPYESEPRPMPDRALDRAGLDARPMPDARKGLSPSDLIEWLFHDETLSQTEPSEPDHGPSEPGHGPNGPNNTMAFPQKHPIEFPNGISPMSLLESMFAVSPNFPHSATRKTVDEGIRTKLVGLVPQLDLNPDFGLPQIERCLEVYWLIFHPQYPLLHKPSFSNYEAHPLLLLAMIMLGASLASCTGGTEPGFTDAQRLSIEIAEPLRWLIFATPDCRPPAKVWVVQSLLLLETYEITSSSRTLHERAYLHHGTKIQLLRRSPILGGDPLKDDEDDGAYLPPNHVWKKWIEVESMKRATLMAFYLDTVNATVYGHMVVLYAHQIKISLPCEDELWEFDNNNPQQKLTKEKSPKFLVALRKLLHRQPVKTSTFGRKVLLAGLLTIMFQMQQKDLQLSFLEWNQVKDSWNETISLAIDVWRTDICSQGCCNTENSLKFLPEDMALLPPMLRLDDRRCKFSLYHIAQIYMRITHYDYIIYAGAPSRMNVIAGNSEYAVVEKRVLAWAKSLNGRISAVHAYLFLCEMLLSPDNEDITYSYDPNVDPFLHRKNIMASAILVIFAYNFSLEGPENHLFDTGDTAIGYYPDKEDGYTYLKRIRKLLSSNFGDGGDNFHNNRSVNSTTFHNRIKIFADILLKIPNKHHMVGLMKVFYKSFRGCKWEVGAEYSKLFQNCIERSLGRRRVVCEDMYASLA